MYKSIGLCIYLICFVHPTYSMMNGLHMPLAHLVLDESYPPETFQTFLKIQENERQKKLVLQFLVASNKQKRLYLDYFPQDIRTLIASFTVGYNYAPEYTKVTAEKRIQEESTVMKVVKSLLYYVPGAHSCIMP